MAPLSFLKSSTTSASTSSQRSDSPGAAQSRNRSPSPEPSGTSRYNPARLLRRKGSTTRKESPQPSRKLSDSHTPLPSMVSAGSEVESSEQETEGPQTASSAFFSDIGDHHVSPSGLGFGSVIGGGGNRNADERVGDNAQPSGFSPSRILGSPRSKREGGIWSGGGTNIMDQMPDMGESSAPPAWLSSPPPPSVSRRIMEPSEILADEPELSTRRSTSSPTPPSPSSITGVGSTQTYPTPLSPPRRPMPKSPQPNRHTPPPLAPALSTSSSFSAFPPEKRSHAPSPSLELPSARRPAHRTSSSQGSGSMGDLQEEPRKPLVTAEWLARKPSSSKLQRKDSTGGDRAAKNGLPLSPFAKRRTPHQSRARPGLPANDSDSQEASHDSDNEAIPGFLTKQRSMSTRGGYEVEVTCDDSQWAGDEDEGEMSWKVTIRRPRRATSETSSSTSTNTAGPSSSGAAMNPVQLSSGRSMATAPGTASSINLSLSLDQPTGKLVFIAFPMDLHATPKRRGSATTSRRSQEARPSTPPTGPSPRDLFSAASRSSSAEASNPPSRMETPPPLPTADSAPRTPPPVLPSTPQNRSSSRLDRTEYPVTPTRVRLSGNFSPGPGSAGNFTSPRSRNSGSIARSLSPAFSNGTPGGSGNGLITPGTYSTPTSAARRTRLVNAPDLEGGLYAKGTVDDMSEELEGVSISPR
jgi:hypothetical protein